MNCNAFYAFNACHNTDKLNQNLTWEEARVHGLTQARDEFLKTS
jgi:hypothetical protein